MGFRVEPDAIQGFSTLVGRGAEGATKAVEYTSNNAKCLNADIASGYPVAARTPEVPRKWRSSVKTSTTAAAICSCPAAFG